MATAPNIYHGHCPQCDLPFQCERISKNPPKLCSAKCRRDRDVARKAAERRRAGMKLGWHPGRGRTRQAKQFTCAKCGKQFERFIQGEPTGRECCSVGCARQWERKYADQEQCNRVGTAASNARRRAKDAVTEHFDPFEVLERDGWACYICGIATPKHLRGTFERNAPELDHVIPLAKGGLHTRANTACCCRQCNLRKGNDLI